jgi:quercetin dioxygenase-like cupin family protein
LGFYKLIAAVSELMSEVVHLRPKMEEEISCDDLNVAIAEYRGAGYQLAMIMPADDPREAIMSRGTETLRLVLSAALNSTDDLTRPTKTDIRSEWHAGRAGMEYRDLLADDLGGELSVSHIRLNEGGEVADYVHYHKIGFQMIRCIKGRIKVVYEGQGEAFWLEVGDWVIQPPGIRHRVIECEAGSEVIEFTLPAEHETWADHEMTLPNGEADPGRMFGGQRFVRFVAPKA